VTQPVTPYDISCVLDMDPTCRELSGRRVRAERIARRLTTPRGSCIDAPNDGIDLRDELSTSVDADGRALFLLSSKIRNEVVRDEEVLDARVLSATVTGSANNLTLTVELQVVDGDGVFSMTLKVSDVTVALITEV